MPRAGLNGDRLTEAAAGLVDGEGLQALTLSRIAAELRVAPPSLYKHVAGLEDLVDRVTGLALARLSERLREAVLGRSAREALLSVAQAHRRFALEHRGLYALTAGALNTGSLAQQRGAALASDVLGAVVRGYGVPPAQEVHAIRLVRAGLHGFSDIEGRGGFQLPAPPEESFALLVDVLDAALGRLGALSGAASQVRGAAAGAAQASRGGGSERRSSRSSRSPADGVTARG